MPTYSYRNKETQEVHTVIMSLSEREKFLAENKDYEQVLCAPVYGDSVRLGITKTPDGFQELLKNAKKKAPNSTIQTRT